jgi:hypothetical protein
MLVILEDEATGEATAEAGEATGEGEGVESSSTKETIRTNAFKCLYCK